MDSLKSNDMATKSANKKKSGGAKKGRMKPNVPKAGVKFGSRYGCGGKKSK